MLWSFILFGRSDIVMLFERQSNINITAKAGVNRLISEIEFSELLRTTRGSWRSE